MLGCDFENLIQSGHKWNFTSQGHNTSFCAAMTGNHQACRLSSGSIQWRTELDEHMHPAGTMPGQTRISSIYLHLAAANSAGLKTLTPVMPKQATLGRTPVAHRTGVTP